MQFSHAMWTLFSLKLHDVNRTFEWNRNIQRVDLTKIAKQKLWSPLLEALVPRNTIQNEYHRSDTWKPKRIYVLRSEFNILNF